MTWLIGVALSVTATVCGTLGKVLMKLSHVRGGDMVIFALAITLVVLMNPILDALSFGYAAQSILAPMSGLSVVWNILLSPYVLKEQLKPTDILGTTFVVMGCGIVGLSGNHETPDHSNAELFQFFNSEGFALYMLFVLMWTLALVWIIRTKPQRSHMRRFAFGSLAGTIGGNFFFIKAFVELVRNGKGAMSVPGTYLILVAALVSAGGGLFILNIALMQYEAIYIVSVYQSFLILIGSISGVVFFNELESLSLAHRVAYICGLFTAIIGIKILTAEEAAKVEAFDKGNEQEPLLHYKPQPELEHIIV